MKEQLTLKTWDKSRELLERAKLSLTGGVSSPFRAKCAIPLYFEDGQGSRLRDVDGNEYIDYALAWGPLILGHCHPALVKALLEAARKPHNYGAQHELEFLVSEMIQKLSPGGERVAFTSSGSEALQIVMRLARAFTGREKILKFEGHYHGWMDSALLSYKPSADAVGPLDGPAVTLGSRGQAANSVSNMMVAPWNNLSILERILEQSADEIAAVIMEPVLCNSGCLMPEPGYLESVRELCTRHNVLLIFDEVITGFRIAPGGAQEVFGVTSDLTTYGKAVAGGVPMSVVAGRAEIMEMMLTGGVAFGGTFNGNPLATGAALATLTELSKNDGAGLKSANKIGLELMEGLNEIGQRRGIPVQTTGFGAAFSLHFTTRQAIRDYRDTLEDDTVRLKEFLTIAIEEGLNLLPDGRFYVSAVHTAKDCAETLEVFDRAFARLA
ncbi:MAG: aspartate aminotransferase family protein [Bryobacteraceae bacterium]